MLSAELDVVAFTGTNGKTSTAWWVAQALSSLGRRCGVIGTLGIGEPPRDPAASGEKPSATVADTPALRSTGLTTPDPIALQNALAATSPTGASRPAPSKPRRSASLYIASPAPASPSPVFTNFMPGPPRLHGDMQAYWQAKAQLFAWPDLRAAVVNLDDAQGSSSRRRSIRPRSTSGPSRRSRRAGAPVGRDWPRERRPGLHVSEGERARRDRDAPDRRLQRRPPLGMIGVLRALGLGLVDAASACATLRRHRAGWTA